MQWVLKTFDELTVKEFHDILQLRIDVFVVEQNCPYSELDRKDFYAYHFFALRDPSEILNKKSSQIIAYTRLFKPKDYYRQAAIGRVVVHPEYRKKNIGYELIKNSIDQIFKLFNTTEIKIGAQIYLQKFYEDHGFNRVGESYIEDGIPHIYMLKK